MKTAIKVTGDKKTIIVRRRGREVSETFAYKTPEGIWGAFIGESAHNILSSLGVIQQGDLALLVKAMEAA